MAGFSQVILHPSTVGLFPSFKTSTMRFRGLGRSLFRRELHPILDLRCLNRALRVSKFKMLTVKSILSQIQPRDWFVTIDLKDAYFHIQIVKRRRKFPKVCFRGQSLPILCSPVWKATGHPNTYIVILRNAAYGRSSGPVAALGCLHFELLGQLANISSIPRSGT